MNDLDKFFGDVMGELDALNLTPLLSSCCASTVFGEVFRDFGRCSSCMEMAEFSKKTE